MIRSIVAVSVLAGLVALSVSCAKKTPEEKLAEAREAWQKRDWLGAIVLANAILREHTTGPIALDARRLLVNCHVTDRNYQAARRVLNEIIDMTGLDSAEGQQAAGVKLWTYDVAGQRSLARQQTESFLEATTTGTLFWAELKLKHAAYLSADEERTTAVRELAMVFAHEKVAGTKIQIDAMNQLAEAYSTTETARTGIEYFQSYLDDSPTTNLVPNIHMIMGHLARTLDEEKEAEGHFQKAFQAYSGMYEKATGADEKIPILTLHARSLSFKGDVEKAAELLRGGIKEFRSHPDRIELHRQLASLYARNQRSTEAIAVCRNIVAEFHNDKRRIGAMFMIGDILLNNKQYDAASEEYKNIAMLFPDDPRVAAEAYKRMQYVGYQRKQDAQTSATLLFGDGTTTPTGEPTSPTTKVEEITTPALPSTPTGSAETSPTLSDP